METRTATEQSPEQKAAKRLERRKTLEAIVDKLKTNRRQRLSKLYTPNWSPAELAMCPPFAEKIKTKQISYYAACMTLTTLLPNRSFEAIRKKLKNLVNYGTFGQ